MDLVKSSDPHSQEQQLMRENYYLSLLSSCFTFAYLRNEIFPNFNLSYPGSPGAVEGKLGKNRTEADMRRYIDERDRLEREREEVRSSLASLKKERRETKEELSACQGRPALCSFFSHTDVHRVFLLLCPIAAVCSPLRSQATGLPRSRLEAERRGVSGGGAPPGRGGAATDGGEGKSEEGGGWAFHTGNHTGQQPPGHAHGKCAGCVRYIAIFDLLACVGN